jgi:hypothetical protein
MRMVYSKFYCLKGAMVKFCLTKGNMYDCFGMTDQSSVMS